MMFPTDQDRLESETLSGMIARTQIAVAPPTPTPQLPAGFDDVDLAILDWIVAEQNRATARNNS
jgi:hypothetical protein